MAEGDFHAMLVVIILVVFVHENHVSLAHPQCLDFLPPFSPTAQLAYCSEYSTFGCCSASADASVQTSVSNLQAEIAKTSNPARCQAFVKEISCARCSPYASHIYSAETTGTATRIAGLCENYCLEAVAACGMNFMQELSSTEHLTYGSPAAFCRAIRAVDQDYCLPYVRNFTERQSLNAMSLQRGRLNCVCVKEVMIGLRNPVVAVNAGDGSNRMFVGEQLGVVRILHPNGTISAAPFVDLQDIVVTSSRVGDERGLLGMAFHPNHSSNGFVFFHLNVARDSSGRRGLFNQVLRFTVENGNPDKVCCNLPYVRGFCLDPRLA